MSSSAEPSDTGASPNGLDLSGTKGSGGDPYATTLTPGDDHSDGSNSNLPPSSSPTWSPQDSPSTCTFTCHIPNYLMKRESGSKKAEYSRITTDERGNRWRLIIYVNGNGKSSNNHLSLFLQVADSDDLPFGWSKNVSYVLTLLHPSSPPSSHGSSPTTTHPLNFAKRNPDKTFKLCPKAIDWGWSQFVTSDKIMQGGFIWEGGEGESDGSLWVQAQVRERSELR